MKSIYFVLAFIAFQRIGASAGRNETNRNGVNIAGRSYDCDVLLWIASGIRTAAADDNHPVMVINNASSMKLRNVPLRCGSVKLVMECLGGLLPEDLQPFSCRLLRGGSYFGLECFLCLGLGQKWFRIDLIFDWL